jgi:hypothetical protein
MARTSLLANSRLCSPEQPCGLKILPAPLSQGKGFQLYQVPAPNNVAHKKLSVVQRFQIDAGAKTVNCTALHALGADRILAGASKPCPYVQLFNVQDGSLLQTYAHHKVGALAWCRGSAFTLFVEDTVFSIATSAWRVVSGGGQNDNTALVMRMLPPPFFASF